MGSGEVGAVTGDQWLGSTRHRTVREMPKFGNSCFLSVKRGSQGPGATLQPYLLPPSPWSPGSTTPASLLFPHHTITGWHCFCCLESSSPSPFQQQLLSPELRFLLICGLLREAFLNYPSSWLCPPPPPPSLPFWFHLPYFVSLHSTYHHLQIYYLLVDCLPLLLKSQLLEGKDLAHWSIPHAYMSAMHGAQGRWAKHILRWTNGWVDGKKSTRISKSRYSSLHTNMKALKKSDESNRWWVILENPSWRIACFHKPWGQTYHELRAFPPMTWCAETEHIWTVRERKNAFLKW